MKYIILDTNVFVTALMSKRGASYKLLSLLGTGLFEMSLSVPLVLEYEDAAKRYVGSKIVLSTEEIDDIIDYLCKVSHHQKIFYLWRPTLKDPRDDFVLELAVNAGAKTIITYNKRDFQGAEHFDVSIQTPKDFLEQIGALP